MEALIKQIVWYFKTIEETSIGHTRAPLLRASRNQMSRFVDKGINTTGSGIFLSRIQNQSFHIVILYKPIVLIHHIFYILIHQHIELSLYRTWKIKRKNRYNKFFWWRREQISHRKWRETPLKLHWRTWYFSWLSKRKYEYSEWACHRNTVMHMTISNCPTEGGEYELISIAKFKRLVSPLVWALERSHDGSWFGPNINFLVNLL